MASYLAARMSYPFSSVMVSNSTKTFSNLVIVIDSDLCCNWSLDNSKEEEDEDVDVEDVEDVEDVGAVAEEEEEEEVSVVSVVSVVVDEREGSVDCGLAAEEEEASLKGSMNGASTSVCAFNIFNFSFNYK